MQLARVRLLVVVVALCALCVVADAASAAPPSRGVLSISPARRSITGRPPAELTSTLVKNTTEADIQVRVYPVLLFQNLDGSFGFNPSARELNEAKLQLGVAPTSFELKAGTQNKLALRWQLLPSQAKAAYLGLVIEGVPQLPGKKSVGTVLRLLSVNFFKLPGRFEVSGKLTGVRGQQAGPRVLRFLPRVKNTGEIHAQPQNGHCKIVDGGGAGAVRYEAKFGSGVILPGYSREYPILVRKVLPAGSYKIKCATRFGRERSTANYPFRLSGPNTLPTPNMRLKSVKASGEVGSQAKVHVVIRNRGSAASDAILKVSLQTLGGETKPRTIARVRVPEGKVGGGQEKSVDLSVGRDLGAGSYAADVVLSNGTADVDELTSSFTTTKSRGFFAKIWDWFKDHLAWLIALIALLGLLFLFLLYRSRRREMEEELAAARQYMAPGEPRPPAPAAAAAPAPTPERAPPPPAPKPEPAPPPPAPPAAPISAGGDGPVNLNSASLEELMTLPGVGRRAAERIIAAREAQGGFTSLDDLSVIEGFHAERIKRLSGSAEV